LAVLKTFNILSFLVVARYTEGSESYALHNSLRVSLTPDAEREGYIDLLNARCEKGCERYCVVVSRVQPEQLYF